MAFNFNELDRIKNNISSDSEELHVLLRDLNNLINDNVGSFDTWDSQKANEFKNKWNDFSNENFPMYEKSFSSQVNILNTAIKSYSEAENGSSNVTRTTNSVNTKSTYEKKIEQLSENNTSNVIVNEENAGKAIESNIKNTKELSGMFNQELYKGFKAAVAGGGLVAGATKIGDIHDSTQS